MREYIMSGLFKHSQKYRHLFADKDPETIFNDRYYRINDGLYPAITSITQYMDKDVIDRWRERVGIKEAKKVLEFRIKVGSYTHDMLETYLKNDMTYNYFITSPQLLQNTFLASKKILDDNITLIYDQEVSLHSDILKIAGRADLVGEWNGIPSIIDFKTATTPKKEAWIKKYFIQTYGYSVMWEERTSQKINQVVVIVLCDSGEVQIFIRNKNSSKKYYVKELIEWRKYFQGREENRAVIMNRLDTNSSDNIQ